MKGEFTLVSMLYKTNIFGIIGSENNDDYKQNQVLIWDDSSNKILYKMTLSERVLNLKLKRHKNYGIQIFIVCSTKIYILHDFIVSLIIPTGQNPNGLIAINYNEENTIVVYPSCKEDQEKGELSINNLDKKEVKYLFPHNHKVAYIALSYNGLLLATASTDGKKIRIFETETFEKLQELNRGQEKAEIKYISIDFRNQFLAASSERGTIHIWSLSISIEKLKKSGKFKIIEGNNENKISNTGSIFAGLPSIFGGGFFNNEWSFAQVRLDEPYSIFHFGLDNSLIIITSSGKYYKAKIDLKKGGDCQILEECYL